MKNLKGKVTMELSEYDKLQGRITELEDLIKRGVTVNRRYGDTIEVEFSLKVFGQYIIDMIEDNYPDAEIKDEILLDDWYKASRHVANLPQEPEISDSEEV